MKTVRLKDRMWFGKYKGARINDVILKDKKILDELCNKGLIKYDEKVLKFIKQNYERNEKKSIWGETRHRGIYDEPIPDQAETTPTQQMFFSDDQISQEREVENLSFQQRMERSSADRFRSGEEMGVGNSYTVTTTQTTLSSGNGTASYTFVVTPSTVSSRTMFE